MAALTKAFAAAPGFDGLNPAQSTTDPTWFSLTFVPRRRPSGPCSSKRAPHVVQPHFAFARGFLVATGPTAAEGETSWGTAAGPVLSVAVHPAGAGAGTMIAAVGGAVWVHQGSRQPGIGQNGGTVLTGRSPSARCGWKRAGEC